MIIIIRFVEKGSVKSAINLASIQKHKTLFYHKNPIYFWGGATILLTFENSSSHNNGRIVQALM